MIEISEKENCSGCEACANICPVSAISMVPDIEGFLYPRVDTTKCINCNKCNKVCPIINFDLNLPKKDKRCIYKKAYAVKNPDEQIRVQSSSGGVFYLLANAIIESNGVVVGAAFDEHFNVHHIIAQTNTELRPLIGSKYVQSSISSVYREVAKILKTGRLVLFTGLSCQIEGLKAFLRSNYDNLFCLDLICMGIPSPGVWDKYLSSYFDRESISTINFKDKTQGWHKFSVAISFKDRENFLQTGFDNYYMQAMFKGYSLRPSCFSCKFKCEVKCADITIADCWGCERYLPDMDDNKGLSMLIVHTENGMKILRMIHKSVTVKEFDYSNVLKENSNYYNCAKQSNKKRLFVTMMQKVSPKLVFAVMCRNPQKSFFMKVKRKLHI